MVCAGWCSTQQVLIAAADHGMVCDGWCSTQQVIIAAIQHGMVCAGWGGKVIFTTSYNRGI